MVVIVYVMEAHFVERDAVTGEVAEGWPIGYYEFEYPQHKSLQDRKRMARLARTSQRCMQVAHRVLVDPFHNPFNTLFGAWPEQVMRSF